MRNQSEKLQVTPEARPIEILLILPPDAILNVEEARIYSRLKSRQAIYNWLSDKDDPLPASKKGGWRILKSDLDAYLRKKHNRRDSDQPEEHGTSDETLRKQLGQLIEICQAIIQWKRAVTIWRAAGNPFGPGGGKPDLEWLNEAFNDADARREHLMTLTDSISGEMLTRIRFMLPSIHSDLALNETSTEKSGVKQSITPTRALSR